MSLEILNRFLAEDELTTASINRLEILYPSQAPRPKTRHRRGPKPPAPEPTGDQIRTLMDLYEAGRTQVWIASALGVPRSTIRIWYKRRGLKAMSRLEGRKCALAVGWEGLARRHHLRVRQAP